MANQRQKSREKNINRIDPIYIFLDRILFKSLFQPPKANNPYEFEIIEEAQTDFLVENMKKHRIILWINILLATFLGLHGLDVILSTGNTSIVVTGLLAPAMITGAAWYAISFGGIPEKFISIAFTLTLCMFLSFTLSMTLLTCLLVSITPWFIGVFVIIPIYLTLYTASMLYDNVDGLKIGLDSTLLKMSRASISFYRKHGLVTQAETEKEAYASDTVVGSSEIALFTYYVNNLTRNLDQLEENKDLYIANHLIASSTELLYNIIDIGIKRKKVEGKTVQIERDKEFNDFVHNAHKMSQLRVDELALKHLKTIVNKLKSELDDVTGSELEEISKRLENYDTRFMNSDSEDKEVKIDKQKLGDLIFSQTFRQLLELVSAYRQFLFGTEQ